MTDLLKERERLVAYNLIQLNWNKVEELVAILEPIYVLTKQLQKENLTAGDFLVHLHQCKFRLKNLTQRTATDMLDAIEGRSSVVLGTIKFKAALFFDFRFVHSGTDEQSLPPLDP